MPIPLRADFDAPRLRALPAVRRMKFNAHGPDGLIDRKAPGQPSKLTEAHRAALKAVIETGPTAAIDGVVRRRLVYVPMDFGGILGRHRQADPEPGSACDGLPQVVRQIASPCPSRWRHKGF
jgi:hypothetical protein